jgi:hypothetical protein
MKVVINCIAVEAIDDEETKSAADGDGACVGNAFEGGSPEDFVEPVQVEEDGIEERDEDEAVEDQGPDAEEIEVDGDDGDALLTTLTILQTGSSFYAKTARGGAMIEEYAELGMFIIYKFDSGNRQCVKAKTYCTKVHTLPSTAVAYKILKRDKVLKQVAPATAIGQHQQQNAPHQHTPSSIGERSNSPHRNHQRKLSRSHHRQRYTSVICESLPYHHHHSANARDPSPITVGGVTLVHAQAVKVVAAAYTRDTSPIVVGSIRLD